MTGARTPVLALLSLRRLRNLAAVAAPFAVLGLLAALARDPAVTALALAPAPLIAPYVASLVGARSESAGALMSASVVVSLALLLTALPGALPMTMALWAFIAGVVVASTVPTIRDAALPVLDAGRVVAIVLLLGAAALSGASLVDPRAYGVAFAVLAVGTITAALAARIFGGDPRAAVVGAGARDPAVAAGVSVGAGIAGGAEIAIAAAALSVLAAILWKVVVRRDAGREAAR